MSTSRIFDIQRDGQTLIVIPQGDVSTLAGEDVQAELDDLLARLDRPDLKHVVVDFHKVSYFGTSMLGALHAIWARLRAGGGTIILCNLSDNALEVLRVARFDTLWPICNSREEALEMLTR